MMEGLKMAIAEKLTHIENKLNFNCSNSIQPEWIRSFTNMPHIHQILSNYTNNCGNFDQNRCDTNETCANAQGFQSGTYNGIPQCTDIQCDNDYASESEISRIAASCVRRYTLEESKALATMPSNCFNDFCNSTDCGNAEAKTFCSCDHMSSGHQNATRNAEEQSAFCLNPSQPSSSAHNYPTMSQYNHTPEGTYGDSNQVAAQCSTMDQTNTLQTSNCVRSPNETFQQSYDPTPSQCNLQQNQPQVLADQCSPCRIDITGCDCDYKTPTPETNSKMRSCPGQLNEGVSEKKKTPILRLASYENKAKYENATCEPSRNKSLCLRDLIFKT